MEKTEKHDIDLHIELNEMKSNVIQKILNNIHHLFQLLFDTNNFNQNNNNSIVMMKNVTYNKYVRRNMCPNDYTECETIEFQLDNKKFGIDITFSKKNIQNTNKKIDFDINSLYCKLENSDILFSLLSEKKSKSKSKINTNISNITKNIIFSQMESTNYLTNILKKMNEEIQSKNEEIQNDNEDEESEHENIEEQSKDENNEEESEEQSKDENDEEESEESQNENDEIYLVTLDSEHISVLKRINKMQRYGYEFLYNDNLPYKIAHKMECCSNTDFFMCPKFSNNKKITILCYSCRKVYGLNNQINLCENIKDISFVYE